MVSDTVVVNGENVTIAPPNEQVTPAGKLIALMLNPLYPDYPRRLQETLEELKESITRIKEVEAGTRAMTLIDFFEKNLSISNTYLEGSGNTSPIISPYLLYKTAPELTTDEVLDAAMEFLSGLVKSGKLIQTYREEPLLLDDPRFIVNTPLVLASFRDPYSISPHIESFAKAKGDKYLLMDCRAVKERLKTSDQEDSGLKEFLDTIPDEVDYIEFF